MKRAGKYESAKEESTAICRENRYGYLGSIADLHNRSLPLNHKAVQRLMKERVLICRVQMKKYYSYKDDVGKIAPDLMNRDSRAEKPNQKRVTDTMEFSLYGEQLSLSPIPDLYGSDVASYTNLCAIRFEHGSNHAG